VGKSLKWILAACSAALGLLASFALPPTIFECQLFTACHELNMGYALVSIFSSETSKALAEEQVTLQIAHSTALVLIAAVFSLIVGAVIEPQIRSAMPPSVHAEPGALADHRAPPAPLNGSAADLSLELIGTGRLNEYHLKVDATELADLPIGLAVGREEAVFNLNDESVSKGHARLRFQGGGFVVEDMGSTNGTRLNGRKLGRGEAARLHGGDRLAFGAAIFDVQLA